jgi:hypothetical protein
MPPLTSNWHTRHDTELRWQLTAHANYADPDRNHDFSPSLDKRISELAAIYQAGRLGTATSSGKNRRQSTR